MFQYICLSLLSIIFLSQCSTSPPQKNTEFVDKVDVQQKTPLNIQISTLSKDKIYGDIRKFINILNKRKPLSESDWQLHDALLKTYIQLKYYPEDGVLKIPARTRLSLSLKSYCLDPRRANPERNEVYSWKKISGEHNFLKGVLNLSRSGKYSQKTLQGLLWNLKNKTRWDDYPENEQEILKQVDPGAPMKLPSKVKSEIQSEVLEQIQSQLPEGTQNVLNLIEGQYNSYEIFKGSIERRKSEQSLPLNKVGMVGGTTLYVENISDGFEDQEVTFYNPSTEDEVVNLSEFYQEPFRKDVQALAAYFALNFDAALFKELEKLLFDDRVRFGLSYTPVMGDLIDLYEASTGRNFFTDDWLTNHERFMSAMSVLAGSGQTYRYAEKVLRGPANYIDDVEKKYRQIRNTESYKELEKLAKEVEGKGIPDDWKVKVSKPGKAKQGIEYVHPDDEHTKIRVMPGKSDNPHTNPQDKYVRVQRNGDYYDKNGNPTNDDGVSHIPLNEFDTSKFPWIKK